MLDNYDEENIIKIQSGIRGMKARKDVENINECIG